MKIWLNGELVEREQAKISVLDHGTLYGDGVFEGIRVYGGKIFKMTAHVDRFYASAKSIRLEIPYTKQEVRDAMYAAIEANSITEGYIRLVITRGVGNLGLNPFECLNPNVYVIAAQIKLYPEELYASGMAVIIAKTVRTSATMLNPSTKSLNYLNNIQAKIEAIDAGVAEAVMLNAKGEVAECTGDNIFIVKDGRVITPPEDAGILIGITRGVAIDLAAELSIPVDQSALTVEQLYAADECFLTGTAAEIISVTKVDDKPISDSKPGPITLKLLSAFRAYIATGDFE